MKVVVIVLSGIATVHGVHMLSFWCEVWQHVLGMPTSLDGIAKIVANIIVLSALGVLLLSYPITKAIILSIQNK